MIDRILIIFALFLSYGCGSQNIIKDYSSTTDYSPYSEKYKVVAKNISIDSPVKIQPVLARNISEQIRFLVGPFMGMNGAIDVDSARITVKTSVQIRKFGVDMWRIIYDLEVDAVLPTNSELESIKVVFPSGGDNRHLSAFYRMVFDNNSFVPCFKATLTTVNRTNLWYYLRPNRANCTLNDSSHDDVKQPLSVMVNKLSIPPIQSTAPHYSSFWSDNVLKTTIVFGKDRAGAMLNSDEGNKAFKDFFFAINEKYGPPLHSSLEDGALPGANMPYYDAAYLTPSGKLELYAYLIDQIDDLEQDIYPVAFTDNARKSDFVSYNGHSGLGYYIERFIEILEVDAGIQQLYYLNGCTSYSYRNKDLFNKFKRINSHQDPEAFVDVIANTQSGYFADIPSVNVSLLTSLVSKNLDYKEILLRLPSNQRPVVLGEESSNY